MGRFSLHSTLRGIRHGDNPSVAIKNRLGAAIGPESASGNLVSTDVLYGKV